jgi:hypothetical protein
MPDKACEFMIDGHPAHSRALELRICSDSRREDCKYWVYYCLNNDFISLKQDFCGYQFRKKREGN